MSRHCQRCGGRGTIFNGGIPFDCPDCAEETMESMSETPRTDSQARSADRFGDLDVVSAVFARQLERELADMEEAMRGWATAAGEAKTEAMRLRAALANAPAHRLATKEKRHD